jgi:ABC-type transporter lipoprotein component MlaA
MNRNEATADADWSRRMDKTPVAVKIQKLRKLAARLERLAQHATTPNVQDRYLKVADLYRRRAEAERRNILKRNGS